MLPEPSTDSRGRSALRLALGTLFLVSLAVGATCTGERDDRGRAEPEVPPEPGAPPPPPVSTSPDLHAQVSLFWGGGARREWAGRLRIEPPQGRRREIGWFWVVDFEEGDLFRARHGLPLRTQKMPRGWAPARPEQFSDPEPAGGGSRLETVTEGDADGLRFELTVAADSALVLDLGAGAVLRATLEELVRAPVVERCADGNVLVGQATDLARAAPLDVSHDGRTARRASLHTHSSLSTNPEPLESVVESLRPFARTIWWTDHNVVDPPAVPVGGFEDGARAGRYWKPEELGAELVDPGIDRDAFRSKRCYRLTGRGDGEGRVQLTMTDGGYLLLPLASGPVLRWTWKPLVGEDGTASIADVLVTLNSRRRIRYFNAAPPRFDPAEGFVVGGTGGEWHSVERHVLEDARQLHGDVEADGIHSIVFEVLCPDATVDGVMVDAVSLTATDAEAAVGRMEAESARFEDVRSFVGVEQSQWRGPTGAGPLYPHFTVLTPVADPALFRGFDHAPTAAERRAFVERVQAAGGCVGAHHLQIDDHHDALIAGDGLGVDLFEVGDGWLRAPAYETEAELRDRDAHGYPPLESDELLPLLVRWDRLTARGLLLAGYGAPDLHQRFDEPSGGWMNRWLTWILADDDSPESLLRAVRRGQAVPSDGHSSSIVRLVVDGREWMGKLVPTDRERVTVEARVTAAIPGSSVRWIRGELRRDVADAPATGGDAPVVRREHEERSQDEAFASRLELDTRRGGFVRAELLNPAGQVVALTNPVVFVPYWPTAWRPGTAAFDWRGVALAGERDVTLEHAAVDADGSLCLTGTAHGPRASLTFTGPGVRVPEATGAAGPSVLREGDALRVDGLPEGPFELRLAFDAPWPVPETADVLALPDR